MFSTNHLFWMEYFVGGFFFFLLFYYFFKDARDFNVTDQVEGLNERRD